MIEENYNICVFDAIAAIGNVLYNDIHLTKNKLSFKLTTSDQSRVEITVKDDKINLAEFLAAAIDSKFEMYFHQKRLSEKIGGCLK